MEQTRILNWLIGAYALTTTFSRQTIEHRFPESHWLFVSVPVVLFAYALYLIRSSLSEQPESSEPIFRRIDSGHYFRVFFIFWSGHSPVAGTHRLGFWLFAILSAVLIVALVYAASVEFATRKQGVTPFVLGCGFFVYCLLSWGRALTAQHYGVPIIEHFLERPRYEARYYVDAAPGDSERTVRLVAHIHVTNGTEHYESENNRYGIPETVSVGVRDIRIRYLIVPAGGRLRIADDCNELRLWEFEDVCDVNGRSWRVKLRNEPAYAD